MKLEFSEFDEELRGWVYRNERTISRWGFIGPDIWRNISRELYKSVLKKNSEKSVKNNNCVNTFKEDITTCNQCKNVLHSYPGCFCGITKEEIPNCHSGIPDWCSRLKQHVTRGVLNESIG